jgi:hypothetical protein
MVILIIHGQYEHNVEIINSRKTCVFDLFLKSHFFQTLISGFKYICMGI